MAEGAVIACHTVDEWKQQIQLSIESKKLVDVDELESVSQEWKVEAMPTFIFIKEGTEVDKIVGAHKDDLPKKVELLSAI